MAATREGGMQDLQHDMKALDIYNNKTNSTVAGEPLSSDDVDKMSRYFRASMYLCLGMLYLKENPLLQEPLKLEHIKPRLLGHWGSDAGQVRIIGRATIAGLELC